MKYLLYVIIGVLIGLLSYQGCLRIDERAEHRQEVNFLTESLISANSRLCDTVFDTAWVTVEVIRRIPARPLPQTPQDTSTPCRLNWYQDTLKFEDLELAYDLSTLGTLEDMQFSYKNLRPAVLNVPTPCPTPKPPPVPVKFSPWSMNVMMGFPACGYIGGQYNVTPKIGATGGVFMSNTSTNALIGVRFTL